jgi:DNA replication protein DnaC
MEGFIVRLEDGSEVWRWCERCHQKKLIQRLMKSSRITEEFKKLSFTNFVLEGRPEIVHHAFYCAEAYLENFVAIRNDRKNSIALLGRPGSGKTHLLIAIANKLLSEGIGVLYFPWVEGMNDLKENFDHLNVKLHHMKTVSVLFIDDLFKGRAKPTEWQKEQLFEIINYRYLNHLPIMVSSEKDVDQILDIDEGIGSRIYEMCKDFTVILKGDKRLNYRLQDEAV